jgi:hypothetical protein
MYSPTVSCAIFFRKMFLKLFKANCVSSQSSFGPCRNSQGRQDPRSATWYDSIGMQIGDRLIRCSIFGPCTEGKSSCLWSNGAGLGDDLSKFHMARVDATSHGRNSKHTHDMYTRKKRSLRKITVTCVFDLRATWTLSLCPAQRAPSCRGP